MGFQSALPKSVDISAWIYQGQPNVYPGARWT